MYLAPALDQLLYNVRSFTIPLASSIIVIKFYRKKEDSKYQKISNSAVSANIQSTDYDRLTSHHMCKLYKISQA